MEQVNQESLAASEQQRKKLRSALLMKRLTNFIPIVGTAVLAALFFAVCVVKGYAIDTNLIVVIKRAMIIGFLATGASSAPSTCRWARTCWCPPRWARRYITPRAASF